MTEKEYRETYTKGYLQCVNDLINDIGAHKDKISKELSKDVFDLLLSNSLGLSRIKDFELTDWIEEASDNEIHKEET